MNEVQQNNMLGEHCRVFYKKYSDVQINISLRKSLIKNCIFENCSFVDVDFTDAEIINTQFINCSFSKCCFEDVNWLANWVNMSSFLATSFENIMSENNKYYDTLFHSCKYTGCSITKNRYSHCSITNFNFDTIYIAFNKYFSCKLDSGVFDSSFYYNIFDKCDFANNSIEAYLLGFQLNMPMNTDNTYVFFSQPLDCYKIEEELIKIYETRHMYLCQTIIENLHMLELEKTCISILSKFKDQLLNNEILDNNNIAFLSTIIEFGISNNLFSIYSLYIMKNLIKDIMTEPNSKTLFLVSSDFNALYYLLQINTSRICNELAATKIRFQKILSNNKVIKLVVHYDTKPSIRLTEIISQICPSSNLIIGSERTGSFIEDIVGFVTANADTIGVLADILTIISIVAMPIIKLFTLKKDKKAAKTQKQYEDITVNNKDIVTNVTNIYNYPTINLTINIDQVLTSLSQTTFFDDYSNNNIKNIEIYKEEM